MDDDRAGDAAALVPAAARAGGWATVGLSSLPDGIETGEPWVVDLRVLQHGRTPLDGVHPRVLLSGPGGVRRAVAARPTGEPGVYRARVVFGSGGRWRFAVDDRFTQTHTYAPVRIGGAPARAQGAGDDADWPSGARRAGGRGRPVRPDGGPVARQPTGAACRSR